MALLGSYGQYHFDGNTWSFTSFEYDRFTAAAVKVGDHLVRLDRKGESFELLVRGTSGPWKKLTDGPTDGLQAQSGRRTLGQRS